MVDSVMRLWTQLEFGSSWVGWLLPLPLLVYWWMPEFRQHAERVRVPNLAGLTAKSGLAQRKPRQPQRWPYAIVALVWLSLLLAAAEPQRVVVSKQQQIAVRDILLVLDISGSMAIRDMQDDQGEASRMQVMQQAVADFINKRPHDNIGLVVFGSQALPLTPISQDHNALLGQLTQMVPGMAGPQTSIGDAMGVAVKLYRQLDRESATEQPERMMILLTDGLDTSSILPPKVALRLAQKQRIGIHTIAFGEVSELDDNVSVDTRLLKEIATSTNGSYHQASASLGSLQQVYQAIDDLAPSRQQQVTTVARQPLFIYPLTLAMAATILLLLITMVAQRQAARTSMPATSEINKVEPNL